MLRISDTKQRIIVGIQNQLDEYVPVSIINFFWYLKADLIDKELLHIFLYFLHLAFFLPVARSLEVAIEMLLEYPFWLSDNKLQKYVYSDSITNLSILLHQLLANFLFDNFLIVVLSIIFLEFLDLAQLIL